MKNIAFRISETEPDKINVEMVIQQRNGTSTVSKVVDLPKNSVTQKKDLVIKEIDSMMSVSWQIIDGKR